MSVEISIQKISIRPIDIEKELKSWIKKNGMVGTVSSAQRNAIHFFIPGKSIRGFSLNRQRRFINDRIELRLSVCASESDWDAAYSFLRFEQQRGFTVKSEDGNVMKPNDLSENSALQQADQQFSVDVNALKSMSCEGFLELPTDWFAVPVKREDLPAEEPGKEELVKFRQVLQQRAAKYSKARPAAVIALKTGKTLIVWAGEPLLSRAVDFIVLSSTDFDPKTSVYVPFERTVNELSDGIEQIGKNPPLYYFEFLSSDSPRWTELIQTGLPFNDLSNGQFP
jgi:hypothetical protein